MHIDILCLGNPNLTGDSVGPRVGTMLEKLGADINVIGTVEDPVLRSNFYEQSKRLREGATHIIIDSALGNEIGTIKLHFNGIEPGASLMPWTTQLIGHISILVTTGDHLYMLNNLPEETAVKLANDVYRLVLDNIIHK